MLIGYLNYWVGKKMPNEESDEIGSFGYGFKLVKRADGELEFQPIIINKNVPIEFVIMQMQIYLDDLKRDYHDKYGKSERPSKEE